MLRAIIAAAALALAVVLTVMDGSALCAQTLVQPNPATRPPPSRGQAKSAGTPRAKSCSMFGPGFVNVPGTDACIKIGGEATTEIGR
jgi:Porin subfamily